MTRLHKTLAHFGFCLFLATGTAPLNAVELDLDTPQDIVLPDMGDPSASLMSSYEEKQLGEAFYRSINHQLEVSHDLEVKAYIDGLGHQLAASSDAPNLHFSFFVVEENVINAFAGPGGYIGTNSGLILASENESELASVLAHEIAHVTQRHLFRTFQQASRMNIPTAAGMLAAIILGSQSSELGKAAMIAAQAGAIQRQINFTRSNEKEADRVGIKTLVRAEFDPQSMPAFFGRLQQASRYYSTPPEFLMTHPVTTSRIADTQGRADSYPKITHKDSEGYTYIKAKLRAQTTEDPKEAIDYFSNQIKVGEPDKKVVYQYGLALSFARKFEYQRAIKLLTELVEENPENSYLLHALGEALRKSGDYESAYNYFRVGSAKFPENQAMLISYADAMIETGKAAQAKELLLGYIRTHTPSSLVYANLAQAYERLDNPAESHRYLAEYYYLKGFLREAIAQARVALHAAQGNFYLSSVLDDRLRTFEQEERDIQERQER